jgi:hypothetical protein
MIPRGRNPKPESTEKKRVPGLAVALGFGVSIKLCFAVKLGFGDIGHGPHNKLIGAKIVIVGTHFVTAKEAPEEE